MSFFFQPVPLPGCQLFIPFISKTKFFQFLLSGECFQEAISLGEDSSDNL